MKTKSLTVTAFSLCLFSFPAFAGFDWTPPPAVSKAPIPVENHRVAPDGSFQSQAVPAAPVVAEPISPFPGSVTPLPTAPSPSSRSSGGLVINPYPDQGTPSYAGNDSSLLQEMLRQSGQAKPMPGMIQPLSPVMRKTYPEIQGFGKDIPMAIALSQVLPPDYTFSFAPGVNAGQSVSWQGGKPWDVVMDDMLSSSGLHGDIQGRAVTIKSGSAPVRSAFVPSPPPDLAGAPLVSRADGAPVPLSAPAPVKAVSILSEPEQSGDGMLIESLGASSRQQNSATGRLSAPAVADWGDKPLKMASIPSASSGRDANQTWRAVRGDSLRAVLTDWADDAGIELYWGSEYDYPLDSSVRFTGTFEQAVQNLLTGLRDARPRPIGRLHPNLPDGPPVLILETQQVIE